MSRRIATGVLLLTCVMNLYSQGLVPAERLYLAADYDGALKLLTEGGDPASLALAGKAHYGKGDFPAAIEAFEKATVAEPGNAGYWNWLGKAYGQQAAHGGMLGAMGNARKCRSAFERAVELAPEDLEALGDVFSFYLNAPGILGGGVDKAEAISKRIGGLDAAEYEYTRAAIAQKRKDWPTAERHFREAAEMEPERVGRVLDLATLLSRRERYEDSDQLFAAAGREFPDAPKVWFREAAAHIKADRKLDEARRLLKRYLASALTSDDPPRWEAEKLLGKVATD
jgi:tetratricopeptide (TPR) repeat protein